MLSERLVWIRKEHFDTAKAMAEALGINDHTYRRWERGESDAPIAALRGVSDVTGCSLQWLVTGHGEPYGEEDADLMDAVDRAVNQLGEAAAVKTVQETTIENLLKDLATERAKTNAVQELVNLQAGQIADLKVRLQNLENQRQPRKNM